MNRVLFYLALGSTGLCAACASEPKQAPPPELSSAETVSVGWPTLGPGDARFIRIDLGPDSLEQCRHTAPNFPFDSTKTFAQDRAQVVALASCLNSPGMTDRRILLVGRADPSGANAYNDELGLKRAEAIRKILVDNGIAPQRIDLASRGETGAKGDTAEQSSGYDRRVDIVVRGGVHAP